MLSKAEADTTDNPRSEPVPHEAGPARRWRIPTLAERFDGRTNSIGLLRHVLATVVLVAHSWQVGFNAANPTEKWFSSQTQLGSLGVFGFFAISGYLITGSGTKLSTGRFFWHRFLRIFPGLWCCLAVCAFVIAPAVALAQGQGPLQFWRSADGPAGYFTRNFFAAMDQVTIAGLFADTPYGNGAPTTFNAPLWSLRYELLCYVGVGVLVAFAALRRAKIVVPLSCAALWALLIVHTVQGKTLATPVPFTRIIGPVPLLGTFNLHDLVILAFLFSFGATLQVFKHLVPMHGAVAVVAAVVLVVSLGYGGFLAAGLAAYAYLLLYVAIALPKRLSAIGRRWDYSYGIYIYGYPVQLVLAVIGVQSLGLTVYTVVAMLGTLMFAVPSWHFVEKQAMGLKNAQLVIPRRKASLPAAGKAPEAQAPEAQAPASAVREGTSLGSPS